MSIRSQSWRVSLIGKEIPVTPPILLTALPNGMTEVTVTAPCRLVMPPSVSHFTVSVFDQYAVPAGAENDCAPQPEAA